MPFFGNFGAMDIKPFQTGPSGFGGFGLHQEQEQPKQEEPKQEEPKQEEPKQEESQQPSNQKKEDEIDWSKPQNLSSIASQLVSMPDDEDFIKASKAPGKADSNVKLVTERLKKAGVPDDEIERWVLNMEVEGGGFVNGRELYSTLPGHKGKTTKEKREYFFANKHRYFFRVRPDGSRIPGTITEKPKDWKPGPGYSDFGAKISGGERFYGRTPLQFTHDYNYKSIGDAIGVDLVSNPDLIFDDRVWPEAVIAYRNLKMKEGHKFDTDEGVIRAIAPADQKKRLAAIIELRAKKKSK